MNFNYEKYNAMTTEELNEAIAFYLKDMNEATERGMEAFRQGDISFYEHCVKISNSRDEMVQFIKGVLFWRA